MENKQKKVLIIGHSAKEYALAKKFAEYDCVEKVYVASGNPNMKEFAEVVDLRANDGVGLLNFALENAIDLTIITDEEAIKADIATLFQNNNQMVFAPSAQSALPATSKSVGKKLMYKLQIPIPKFGIFEKSQLALDYIKKSSFPLVIRADENLSCADRQVCNTPQMANIFIDDLYLSGVQKVLLEDFVYGHEFIYYVITDGYRYIPLTSCANYKFMADGNGGILTPGMGCFCPDFKLSNEVQERLLRQVVGPILSNLERRGTPYLGILGVEGVLTPNNDIQILELKPFLNDHDCQAVLNLIDENLYTLFEACAIGSFADDYEAIDISDKASVSCVLASGKVENAVIKGLDLVDDDIVINHFNTKLNEYFEVLTSGGRAICLTKTSSTLARARELLYENVDVIKFSGKKYRTDICKFAD